MYHYKGYAVYKENLGSHENIILFHRGQGLKIYEGLRFAVFEQLGVKKVRKEYINNGRKYAHLALLLLKLETEKLEMFPQLTL